ncbi:hypothetical protein N7532_001693 [Penicillium argentinense]|uniref:Uncharacterized protein n=1 Tax=Penicillium argentinense TaxID=1131581 RepID=A0A9W9G338_9EURO|nr:uncharacterized protein N7532_001693 [Penicillium argentinense]KAJ5111158.1 hypothetical protein N7532_001693 [Penicillium argentinense]
MGDQLASNRTLLQRQITNFPLGIKIIPCRCIQYLRAHQRRMRDRRIDNMGKERVDLVSIQHILMHNYVRPELAQAPDPRITSISSCPEMAQPTHLHPAIPRRRRRSQRWSTMRNVDLLRYSAPSQGIFQRQEILAAIAMHDETILASPRPMPFFRKMRSHLTQALTAI